MNWYASFGSSELFVTLTVKKNHRRISKMRIIQLSLNGTTHADFKWFKIMQEEKQCFFLI